MQLRRMLQRQQQEQQREEEQRVAQETRWREPQERIQLYLSETDVITGDQDLLSSLFYEVYRGYTIYSSERGHCCLHGAGSRGCLRLSSRYVSFPGVQDAKNMIRYFLANGWSARQHMNRRVSEQVYRCLNTNARDYVA